MKISVFHCLLVLLTIGFAVGGCGRKKQVEQDPIVRAYRLIDEQRTDEAIRLLESELNRDPNNYYVKVTLASAYAHRAGVKMQTIFPAMREMKKIRDFSKKLPSTRKAPKETRQKHANRMALMVSKILTQYSGVSDTFAAVPAVDDTQELSLRQAINILARLEEQIRPEDAVYRAVLRVILFKKILTDNLNGDFSGIPDQGLKNEEEIVERCRIDFAQASDTIVTLGKMLVDIYVDIAISNPKNRKNLDAKTAEISNATVRMAAALNSMVLTDEISSIFLAESALQNGFGKIVKCTGP